ncbi:MAG: phenylalanine--tRNA ligase subunit beta [candidate division WOR-3 bacterium]
MPVVSIPVDLLSRLIEKQLSSEELLRVLSELGCDVEGVDPTTNSLKINLLPARPDMFDICGLARCLKGYLGISTGLPQYQFKDSGVRIVVKPGLEKVRPFICAAIVRAIKLDEELIKVMMDLQENLHWGLGRDRRRASIGIYDLNTVEPDFVYQPVAPEGIKFIPLGEDRPFTPAEILKFHPKGQAYQHLLQGFPVYPLLTDRNGFVLSLPPIINSEKTKVTSTTTDLFIDVTGPDEWATNKTLCVICATFADLGGEVQTVKIEYRDGKTIITPDMEPEQITISPAEAEKVIGINLTQEEMIQLLQRMRYHAQPANNNQILVTVPAYRCDVIHPYDVIEDIAIGYGYHRLQPQLLGTATPSNPLKIEELCQLCRRVMTGLGFIETLSLNLSSPEAQFDHLGIKDDGKTILLENPVSVEQRILRRHLLFGILETLKLNSTQTLPQKIFEIGDVFTIKPDNETGADEKRHLAIGMADSKVGFAELKSVIEALAREMDIEIVFTPFDQAPFLAGRCARLTKPDKTPVGICGEVHPEVLERFNLTVPVALAEIDIQTLFSL